MKKNNLILTPGPTSIYDSVLEAMATEGTNPDLDSEFCIRYKHTEMKYNELINGEGGKTFFPTGEGILGLEMSCLNLIEQGEKVLCIANGFFGEGFKEFIEFAGGIPIMLLSDWRCSINFDDVKKIVEENPDISVATMVHCETPCGVTNEIEQICKYLHSKNIISIVDSVSGVAGEKMDFDNYKIDCLLGGSQKCLSAPTGLTFITLSNRGMDKIRNRKTKVKSYYFDALKWIDRQKYDGFAYTQSVQLIYALERALEIALRSDYISAHKAYAKSVREQFVENGFSLYAHDNFSNTVTAVNLPDGISFTDLFNTMKNDHGILIGGGVGSLDGKVFRIGHMGANNTIENMKKLFAALQDSFEKLGYPCPNLGKNFNDKDLLQFDFQFIC